MSSILRERADDVEVVRLNRPYKLNSLSSQMIDELSVLFRQFGDDHNIRVVILTGVGERAFCSGTDIRELELLSEAEAARISDRGQKLCNQIENAQVPVIAAVNGIAAGAGCELALASHLRIASQEASFSLPETKLGLIPGYGGTWRLTRELGVGRALEMMLTGRKITGEEALEFGLINRLVPQAELLREAISLAREIAALSPLSIRACLKAVTQGLDLPLDEGLALESELFAGLFATEDAREGTAAFLEKRVPVFKGR